MAGPRAAFPAVIFSPDQRYRYILTRPTSPMLLTSGLCVFVMLNPSDADATRDDPTIRRCVRFARSWSYGALVVVNLFGFRATDPAALKTVADPVGPDNDIWLNHAAADADVVVAAWGNGGRLYDRGAQVRTMLEDAGVTLHYLGLTDQGEPGHPLFLRKDLKLTRWTPL